MIPHVVAFQVVLFIFLFHVSKLCINHATQSREFPGKVDVELSTGIKNWRSVLDLVQLFLFQVVL